MDIVDEFVVTLGLDPSNYKKESKEFRDDLRRTKEETRRTTRDMESDGRRATESFSRLKNEIVGLFLVVAGARSLGGLVTDLIHGAAETGRFAQSTGLATEAVSAWEGAVRSMGGTAEEARAALAALNAEYTSYMLTGRAVHDADLAALGISAHDLRSPTELAMTLAERSEHMDRRQFTARLQRLGLPDSFIRTLRDGRQATQELINEQYRLGVVTDRDSRTAQEAERAWANLVTQLRAQLRPVLTWLVEQALPWLNEHGSTAVTVVTALGAAFGIMALRMAGLPGLLAAVGAGLVTVIDRAGGLDGVLAGILYQYGSVQIWALRQQLDSIPFTPGLDTPQNRENGRRRLDILQRISEIEDTRNARLRDAGTPGFEAPAAPGAAGQGGTGSPGGQLARVRQTESGNNYNRVVYDLPSPRPPTSMTLGEIHDVLQPQLTRQSRGRRGPNDPGSSAIGAYQFVRGTLQLAAEGVFGAAWRNQRFSPSTQDRMAQWLHARHGVRDWAIGGGARLPGAGGARIAVARAGGTGGTQVSVGSIVVYTPPGTPAHQADAVAREIPRAIQRRGVVTQANAGLK